MAYDENAPLSIPLLKTLQDAYVLLWHFRHGKDTADHYCDWREMALDLGRKTADNPHPFTAFDAATKLRDVYEPNMLRFPDKQPNANRHRLPLQCFARPEVLFEAINEAERRHNQALLDIPIRNKALLERRQNGDKAAHQSLLEPLPWPMVPVELTKMPDDATPVGVGALQAARPVTYREGDVITNQDGTMVELIRDPDTGRLKRVPVEDEPTITPTATPARISNPSRSGASRRPAAKNAPKAPARQPAQASPKAPEPNGELQATGARTTRGHEPA